MPEQMRLFWDALPRAVKACYVLVVIWALAMISVPIQRWTLGDPMLPFGITLGAVLQMSAALVILVAGLGGRRALIVTLVTVTAAWGVEFVGSKTGFPFGTYSYTTLLQPQLGGVPLLIPLAWMMMMPSAWALAHLFTRRARYPWLAFVLVSALVFTAWDLFLDPQMVGWNFWVWAQPGDFNYFGIPWVNYAGWLLASGLISALARVVGLRPERIPLVPALVIYGVTWFLQTVGQLVFWGQPGPALVGAVGMGIPLVLGIRHVWRSRRVP
ncbi:MAG: carotenoid biosynthesis protein [Pleurocapsa minor GSE-CHR-MK-17-07R]|jgi:putative membrane protein|nr:carotenoid biosynthesis protein [Pleurocapsa minor GSE-CHR-MK 17-07R]